MSVEALIDDLSADTRPVRGSGARIAIGAIVGSAATLALTLALLGPRPDLMAAMAMPQFWVKFGYSATIAALALTASAMLARPESGAPKRLWLLLAPLALVLLLAVVEFLSMPGAAWRELMMGHSWDECPWLVAGFALPILAALFLAFRRLAPTRPRLTGATLGLAAGSLSAMLYSLHCDEMGMGFLFIWYSLGMALASLIGAILGARLLRW